MGSALAPQVGVVEEGSPTFGWGGSPLRVCLLRRGVSDRPGKTLCNHHPEEIRRVWGALSDAIRLGDGGDNIADRDVEGSCLEDAKPQPRLPRLSSPPGRDGETVRRDPPTLAATSSARLCCQTLSKALRISSFTIHTGTPQSRDICTTLRSPPLSGPLDAFPPFP